MLFNIAYIILKLYSLVFFLLTGKNLCSIFNVHSTSTQDFNLFLFHFCNSSVINSRKRNADLKEFADRPSYADIHLSLALSKCQILLKPLCWLFFFFLLQVLVMTPQILVHCLCHCLIKMDSIALLIFDECHHAQVKSNHPYAEIMRVISSFMRLCTSSGIHLSFPGFWSLVWFVDVRWYETL